MIKDVCGMNIREGEGIYRLNNTGTRSNGYELAPDKFILEIRRLLLIREVKFCLPRLIVGGKEPE